MLRFIHHHYGTCVALVSLFWFGCYFVFDFGLAALALLDCGCLALLFVFASLHLRRVTGTYSEACDPEPYLELGLWGRLQPRCLWPSAQTCLLFLPGQCA